MAIELFGTVFEINEDGSNYYKVKFHNESISVLIDRKDADRIILSVNQHEHHVCSCAKCLLELPRFCANFIFWSYCIKDWNTLCDYCWKTIEGETTVNWFWITRVCQPQLYEDVSKIMMHFFEKLHKLHIGTTYISQPALNHEKYKQKPAFAAFVRQSFLLQFKAELQMISEYVWYSTGDDSNIDSPIVYTADYYTDHIFESDDMINDSGTMTYYLSDKGWKFGTGNIAMPQGLAMSRFKKYFPVNMKDDVFYLGICSRTLKDDCIFWQMMIDIIDRLST